MRILIATDAWRPQVNGVVRTLTSLARSASALGAEIDFVTPDGFPSPGVPTYPGLRIALPDRREIARRIMAAAPDALHIATERPIGASLLPPPHARIHDFLYHALSRIHCGALDYSRRAELRGAAALSRGGRSDDGRDRLA
jgi:hypothetical protein